MLNRTDAKRQVIADQHWKTVQIEDEQNEELLVLSHQIHGAFGNAVPYSFGDDALRLAAAGLRAPVAMRDGLEQHELGPVAA